MSNRADLDRRLQDILRHQSDTRAPSGGSLRTVLTFSIGLLVGVLASAACAPPRVTKMHTDTQPWRIRYATSDGR